MKTYIAILRGINVGGKTVKIAALKAMFENLGYKKVETYIQSGNVVFNTDNKADEAGIRQKTEEAFKKEFGFEAPIIIRSKEEMQQAVAVNPFVNEDGIDITKLHITFLEKEPDAEKLEKINTYSYPPDRFKIIGRDAYLHCPVSYGESKISNSFFESKLKMKTTTRNWNTVNILLEMAKKIS